MEMMCVMSSAVDGNTQPVKSAGFDAFHMELNLYLSIWKHANWTEIFLSLVIQSFHLSAISDPWML